MNPGSFVRLSEDSEFEFITTSLDDLQVKINRGSAIFELITDKEFKVVINTPKAHFNAIKSGVYRVDVMSDGTAKLEVWKGKAQIGTQAATLKGGQTANVSGEQVAAVAKFDRDNKDAFDTWSKTRAKELGKINAQLMARQMNTSLLFGLFTGRLEQRQ